MQTPRPNTAMINWPAMARGLGAAALWSVCAAPVHAQSVCPTMADLQSGISLAEDSITHDTFQAVGPSFVMNYYMARDQILSAVSLAHGVYPLAITELDQPGTGSGRTSYDYEVSLRQMPKPAPGLVWTTAAQVWSDGAVRKESHQYTFGQLAPIVIGTCQYQAMTMEFRALGAGGGGKDQIEHYIYLPALGLSYHNGSGLAGEDIQPVPRVAITTLISGEGPAQ